MSIPKPDIEKFTTGCDFSLWKMKMRAFLVHQGLQSALEEDDLGGASSSVSDEKKKQIQNKAHSTLILNLSDSILREISEKKTAFGIWNKVESLCMKKILGTSTVLEEKIIHLFYERRGFDSRTH